MRKELIYGAALALAMAGGGVAMAKPTQASPNGEIKGTYNCQLTGGFIAQAGSSAVTQFSVDGKGNVTDTAGELNVSLGAYSVPNPNNTDADFVFPAQYIYQSCDYIPSGGTYSLNANGAGTLSVEWTASGNNLSSPTDCTENITTDFDVIVNSAASFIVTSTDLVGDCATSSINYASCGSSLTGTCVQQAARP